MSRQFLIPWILIAKITIVKTQPPQPPGFDHVDHFQHLFTHPPLPQNNFGIDGFNALHNNHHMIHPHYDLLAQNTHVMNPNFIHHPHPFFPLHPHTFTPNLISSTVSVPTTPTSESLATKPTVETTTVASIVSTTTNEASTLKPTNDKVNETRVPQALKPIVESVKTYSPENESNQKQQMPVLSSLEKMDTSDSKIRKPQLFPTPSSTVLPTAQKIVNQTTTTAVPSTIVSTTTTQATTTTNLPTTNLPKKITEEAERAALNGEKLDLIRHLNTSDLESFLQSANLSTHEAQTFLRLVEKVLEEELQKRLHKQQTTPQSNSEIKPDLPNGSNPTISAAISPIIKSQQQLNNENHEVKTVNTRLNYESSEIDQSGLNNNNSNTQSSRIVAYSQKSNLEINSAQKSHANPTFTSLDEVRKREQEEFDRLLGQIVLQEDNSETQKPNEEPVDQNEDDDLLPPTSSTQQPTRNNFSRGPPTRHPKTNFDQLVQDYQYRLSGNTGFNDLIKALRNGHIGFYDRTKKSYRPRLKIN